ncbi:type II toxin-antitoxin system CcdA family antitoxin [Hyphomonas sp.]
MRQWAEEKRAALQAWARKIEEEGLWPDGLRQF